MSLKSPPRSPSRVKVRDRQIVAFLMPSLPFLPPPVPPPLPAFLEPPYITKRLSIDLSLEESRPPPPYSCDFEEETSNSSNWRKVGSFFKLLLCGAYCPRVCPYS